MNPHLMYMFAEQRGAEIRDAAAAVRRERQPGRRRQSLREQAGWALVNVGLRLVPSPPREVALTPGSPAGRAGA